MPRAHSHSHPTKSSAYSASPAADRSLDPLDAPEAPPERVEATLRKRSQSAGRPYAKGRGEPRVPAYRLHRPSGRAVVTIAGQDYYLGAHGSAESRARYDRLVAEWLGRGRPRRAVQTGQDLTVAAVVLAYWRYIKASYTSRTSQGTVAPTLRRLFGTLPASEFGPRVERIVCTETVGWASPSDTLCPHQAGIEEREHRDLHEDFGDSSTSERRLRVASIPQSAQNADSPLGEGDR